MLSDENRRHLLSLAVTNRDRQLLEAALGSANAAPAIKSNFGRVLGALCLGLVLGWAYYGYDEKTSWEGEAKYAAQAACADIPACLLLAQRYNQGNDVAQYLPSPGR
ncbi:hypothetical protein LJR234_006646 [Mesorhizobium amorphae]|uniref:hypothetical protein n=1 Tax=Mesorhizobium amorphae TaxID=71433 RepID=UPI003ECD6071